MSKNYQEMLDALRISVIEIVNANPADRDAKLEKSFAAYGSTMEQQLQKDVLLAVDEADPVSLIGDRLGRLHEAVDAVEKGACPGSEMLSDESLLLAKSVLEFGGLMLNAAAADFAEPVEDGERVEEGMGLYKVAASHGEVLVKSMLPPAAAEMTADPQDTANRLTEFFMEGLEWLGVPVKLAKKAPPAFLKGKGKAQAQAEDGEGEEEDLEGEEGQEEEDLEEEGAEGEGPEMEEGEEGDEGDGGQQQGPSNPFDVISRAASLALLELNNIKDQMGGGDMQGQDGQLGPLEALGQHLALAIVGADALNQAMGEGGMDGQEGMEPEGDMEGAAPMEDAEPEEALKNTPNDGLAKADLTAANQRAEAAEKDAKALREKVEALEKAANAKPAEPKAMTGVGVALSKQADNASGDSDESMDDMAKRFEKMTPEQRGKELIKMSFRNPMPMAQDLVPGRSI